MILLPIIIWIFLKIIHQLIEYEAYDNKLNLFLNSCYVTDSHPWYWRTFIDGEITKENGCICKIFEQERPLVYCLTHPHMWYYRHFHLVKY